MSRTRFHIALAAIAPICCAAIANAQFASIRTNQNGADAELREEETNVVANIALGTNRGASNELATRGLNSVTIDATQTPPVITNPFPTADRSSISMVKFDISSLPNQSDTTFWQPESKVQFRLYVRNANNYNNLFGPNPTTGEEVSLRMRVRALDPTKVYGDDNPTMLNRTDRVGNAYVASQNKYNWDEAGVTFYNAPGITPHRVVASAPTPPADDFVQTLGIFDDFNSDTLDLGTLLPRDFSNSLAAIPQGFPIIFDNDTLKQLVFSAQTANRTSVTLFFNLDNNTNSHQPTVGINGSTPAGMLNRNYLTVPKELTTQQAGINNTFGDFSPELRVVPEPATLGLAMLGATAALARRRRA